MHFVAGNESERGRAVSQFRDIFIDTTPFCFWGNDLSKDNIAFLKQIDSNYYFTMAGKLDVVFEQDHASAILIRQLYGQALEGLFAFLSAYVQSPHYMIGWLCKYRSELLKSCVSKLDQGFRLPTLFKGEFHGWDDISKQINSYFPEGKRETMIEKYSRLWTKLAQEFLDDDFQYEYNSLKHGSRVVHGGVSISIGMEHEFGVPPPDSEMQSLGGGKYGSTFYVAQKVGSKDKTDNFLVHEHTRNWSPENLIARLRLISFSLCNVVSACLIANGEAPEELLFTNPSRIEAFEEAFSDTPTVLGWQRRCGISPVVVAGHFHGLPDVNRSYGMA